MSLAAAVALVRGWALPMRRVLALAAGQCAAPTVELEEQGAGVAASPRVLRGCGLYEEGSAALSRGVKLPSELISDELRVGSKELCEGAEMIGLSAPLLVFREDQGREPYTRLGRGLVARLPLGWAKLLFCSLLGALHLLWSLLGGPTLTRTAG